MLMHSEYYLALIPASFLKLSVAYTNNFPFTYGVVSDQLAVLYSTSALFKVNFQGIDLVIQFIQLEKSLKIEFEKKSKWEK